MRLNYPRAPHMIIVMRKGKQVEVPRIGDVQMQALKTLSKYGPGEEPAEGEITATGKLRKHVFNDMLPFGWVNFRIKGDGAVEYLLTKRGREILKTAVVADEKKAGRKTGALLARQRAAAAKKAKAANGNGRSQDRRAATA